MIHRCIAGNLEKTITTVTMFAAGAPMWIQKLPLTAFAWTRDVGLRDIYAPSHPYDIRVGQSVGMGLDEKAIEAVHRWRFHPATLNGQPVATQIAVQVDFRLY